MSTIPGTYTNASMNAKLVITSADDATGAIAGNLTVGTNTWPIQGGWNASNVMPNAVFYFSGGSNNPASTVGGVGASTNCYTFENTTISISIALTGGVVTSLSGRFVRS